MRRYYPLFGCAAAATFTAVLVAFAASESAAPQPLPVAVSAIAGGSDQGVWRQELLAPSSQLNRRTDLGWWLRP